MWGVTMSEPQSEQTELQTVLEDRLEMLKHSQAMAVDQLHPNMDLETELLMEIDSVGNEAQIDYIESLLADLDEPTENSDASEEAAPPQWVGEAPTNYIDLRESFELSMRAEGVEESTINTVKATVDDAVVANETHLEWPDEPNSAQSLTAPTFEIDIVWANGSGTDSNVVGFEKIDDGTLLVEYVGGDIERYPYGEVVSTRIESGRCDPDNGIESLVSLEDHSIRISDPGYPEEYFIIEPSGVPTRDCWDAMVLDYYYGRPVLYLHDPEKEDPEFKIALPTEDDPHIRPLKVGDTTISENVEIVNNGRPIA